VCRRAAIPTNYSKIFPSSRRWFSRADGDVAAASDLVYAKLGHHTIAIYVEKKKKKKPRMRMLRLMGDYIQAL
jgi:hypothetical protein